MSPPPKLRLRIRFTKAGKIRFVSHRDVARLFERAMRIVRLPVAYSEGFSPRPKLSFGLALSVGHESDAEYLDVEVTEMPDVETMAAALSDALPDGLSVESVVVLEQGAASLQQVITSCTWRIEVLGAPTDSVAAAVAAALDAPELLLERVRKGKTAVADVRPAILALRVAGPFGGTPTKEGTPATGVPAGDGGLQHGTELEVELSNENTSLRPSELIEVLGRLAAGSDATEPDGGLLEGRVRRTHQWIEVDGIRSEPVSRPDASTRHELRRAS
ncbi:MAG: TIGR03936 family radical SAM-associated protein [Acidimicrobiia bacterium]|nr:TIGR03936 family radical SAM-associated protein [Acidimicrobiia bacterium]